MTWRRRWQWLLIMAGVVPDPQARPVSLWKQPLWVQATFFAVVITLMAVLNHFGF